MQPAELDVMAPVLARAGVRLALVFGSRGRGRATARSDLDLAIDGEDVDACALASDLSLALGCEVDIVALREATLPLLEEVLRDGKRVFEGVAGEEARWRARTIAALEIDRPWFARMRDAYVKRVAARGL
jgi:predicted nucleotidyltransferase